MNKDDYLEKWGRNKDRNKVIHRPLPHTGFHLHLMEKLMKSSKKAQHGPIMNNGHAPQKMNQKFNNSVIIKVSYKDAGREKIMQNTDSAIRYMLNDGENLGFSNDKDKISLDEALEEFKGKKVFKMIISVKDHDPDPEYIREVMAELEREVGHKLKWIAGAHYNTANPHTHLIISREDGAPNLSFDTPLHIPSTIFKETLRKKSVGIANRMYGYRYTQDLAKGYDKDVTRIGWTSLDNRISAKTRRTNCLTFESLLNTPAWERKFIEKRLEFLTENFKDKVFPDKNGGYIFMEDWQQALRDKEKLTEIAPDIKSSISIMRNWTLSQRKDVEGTLVRKRIIDETSEKIAVLVKDKDNNLFYHEQTMPYEDFAALKPGQFISIQYPKNPNRDHRYVMPKITKKGPVR